ncbi:MAG: hypothetical protein K2Y22_16205 [Candidatus Obscuribacterales bacterium]|nr:hypothetical protein [Candidatus Obscuribacterales bacterium]
MRVSNKRVPGLVAGCVIAAMHLPANAASSVLDPYFMVPAPKNTQESEEGRNPKLKKQREKARKIAAKEKAKETLFEPEEQPKPKDIKFDEPEVKSEKPLTPLKSVPSTTTTERKEFKPATTPKAQAPVVQKTPSLISSDRPTIREGLGQIGSGIVTTTKATGYDIAAGSRATVKGVKAIGHGLKWGGEKVATGASATKEKVSNAHQNGFKETLANAGTSIKEGSAAAGSKIWDGTKWVGHGCQVGAVKTLTGIQWTAEKAGNGFTASKEKLVKLFGAGVSDSELATNADPTRSGVR